MCRGVLGPITAGPKYTTARNEHYSLDIDGDKKSSAGLTTDRLTRHNTVTEPVLYSRVTLFIQNLTMTWVLSQRLG